MAALAQPEIRVRIDGEELAQAKHIAQTIGLPLNDAVKVFVRKFIEAKGMPFDMRQPANDSHKPMGERLMPILGLSHQELGTIATAAARKADLAHARAKRLPGLVAGRGGGKRIR